MSTSGENIKPEPLTKWLLLRVWFKDLQRPHDKFCICIDPGRRWFLLINSDPPFGRKARDVALSVSRFEVSCLSHDSYIDTTDLREIDGDGRIEAALADPARCYGVISPTLRKKILAASKSHTVLTSEQLEAIFNGEPALP